MTDEQIIQRCLAHLKNYRSISVSHILKSVLSLNPNTKDIRRIRAKLLENRLYMEDSEIDKDGFFRIRFNPDYEEKHWTKKNPVIFEILRGIIAVGVAVAINFLISEKRIDKLEQQVSILQHKLEKAPA